MMFILAFLITWLLGFILLRLLLPTFKGVLCLLFSLILGYGLISQFGFYTHIVGNTFVHWLTPVLSVIALAFLLLKQKNLHLPSELKNQIQKQDALGLGVLGGLAVVLICEGLFYPMGGWDAWSCWNLKAKFIYLGAEHWKNMLDPLLWRSNTHYPLELPLINVFFWQWTGYNDFVPMLNAIILTLSTAGILFWGLSRFNVSPRISALTTLSFFAIPHVITLSISQYSDILLGCYALAALVCFFLNDREKNSNFNLLGMVFLGFLSFTKTEGTVAAGILFGLRFIFAPKKERLPMLWVFLLAALPTMIFSLKFAPPNAAFINGLVDTTHPSDFNRLQIIAAYPFLVEVLSLKWNGLWIIIIAGMLIAGKNLFTGLHKIPALFIVGYLGIVLLYYWINTFFPIIWWLQTTFDRILYAIVPVIIFWITLSLHKE